ncbi:MAG: hypothetical protein H6632_19730 [Anaerolineales bacterium]|nr:hypothetical protein [Anaerolineales bacterium]
MKIFIIYNLEGEILSVSKVEQIPEDLDQPFVFLPDEESVLEIEATENLAKLSPLQFHKQYVIDIEKKKLMKKTKSSGT